MPETFSKKLQSRISQISQSAWIAVLATCVATTLLMTFVDLSPHVDNDFFFSSDDPHFQADNEISKLFTRKDAQLVISVKGNILSEEYKHKIEHLSELLISFKEVFGVKSISHGPHGTEDAQKSPLWKRLLICEDKRSTNIIVLLDENASAELIARIEQITDALQEDNFQIKMSGLPYIVELIRRNLTRDLQIFSVLAFLLFGTIIFMIFRSFNILLGIIIACTDAWVLTLLGTTLAGIKIGLLTANLVTIIIVLTLSHIIFLTFNWQKLQSSSQTSSSSPVQDAVKLTFAASFWSMITTLLGFISLLFVAAKPLRELGVSGAIGTAVAILVAYTVYPLFLKSQHEQTHADQSTTYFHRVFLSLEKNKKAVAIGIFGILLLAIPGLWLLNTDPSMISYFSQKSEIAQGLNYIDRNGGSSPLVIVSTAKSGEKMITGNVYKQLWDLQEGLENHESVGAIISLPVLMAESKRTPLTFFLSWNWLLDILEKPQYGEIAKSFVTEDRQYGLFLLRMKEYNRNRPRLEIIEELKKIVHAYDFTPHLIGGVYSLQGHLSKLVASSLIFGLGRLILLFAIIAYVVSHCWRTTFAMTASISIIPLCILGGIGLLGIPLDIISAPAANVAIGLGIDSMIHMTKAYRRLSAGSQSWDAIREQLWQPILTSTLIISVGFGIFFFSSFPPTQRFGGAIVFGTIIASLTALFVFPLLTQIPWERIPLLFNKKQKS